MGEYGSLGSTVAMSISSSSLSLILASMKSVPHFLFVTKTNSPSSNDGSLSDTLNSTFSSFNALIMAKTLVI